MGIPSLPGVSGSDKVSADRANGVVSGTISGVGPGKAFSAWGPLNFVLYGSRVTSLAVTAGSTTGTASGTGKAVGDAVKSTLVPPGTTVGSDPSGGTFTMKFAPQAWAGLPAVNSLTVQMTVDAANKLPNGKALSTLVGATVDSPYFASGVTVVMVGADGTSLVMSAAATSAPAANKDPPLIWFAPTGNVIDVAGTDTAAVFTGVGSGYQPSVLTGQLERSFDGGSTWVGVGVGFGALASLLAANMPYSIAFGDPEASVLYRVNTATYTATSGVTVNYRVSTTGQASVSLSVPAIM